MGKLGHPHQREPASVGARPEGTDRWDVGRAGAARVRGGQANGGLSQLPVRLRWERWRVVGWVVGQGAAQQLADRPLHGR